VERGERGEHTVAVHECRGHSVARISVVRGDRTPATSSSSLVPVIWPPIGVNVR
jgi:hypothetical protein